MSRCEICDETVSVRVRKDLHFGLFCDGCYTAVSEAVEELKERHDKGSEEDMDGLGIFPVGPLAINQTDDGGEL